jgi:hypothetical protein
MSTETFEPYGVPDAFCEALARIERIGSCRRLVFVVNDHGDPSRTMKAVVAKLVVPAELMAEIAQMIAADRPEPRSLAFPSTP